MAYVKYPTAKQFRKDLDERKLDKMYLFLGEEEGEKDKYIQIILEMIFKDPTEKRSASGRFHIENDELLAAADFALSQSMFSSHKVCIIMNLNKISSGKNAELILEDILDNSPDSTTIIMTSAENSPPKCIKANQLKKLKIVQFWRYFDQDIFNYLSLNLKKMGLTVDDKAIQVIIEHTGKDIKKVDDAIEILKYSGETGYIGEDLIRSLIHDVKEVSIFEFIDLLFKKDRSVLKFVKKLLEEGATEISILSRITWQAESIEKYHYELQQGIGVDEALKSCGIYERNKTNFLSCVKYFDIHKIKKVFLLIAKADMNIKSSTVSKNIIANPIFNLVTDILLDV